MLIVMVMMMVMVMVMMTKTVPPTKMNAHRVAKGTQVTESAARGQKGTQTLGLRGECG
jgi:hypothetical protein